MHKSSPPTHALSCRGLSLGYGQRLVLQDVSIGIERGTWTAVVGPNGAGQSTLLRALAGLMVPRAGVVQLDDKPLTSWAPRARGQRLAWLAQAVPASELRAYTVVALGRLAHGHWLSQETARDRAIIERVMRATGSLEWADRRLSTLSGGERQRVHLARMLAVEASVLVLDEPTTHLEPPHQEDIVRLLRSQAHGCGVTVVSAIHDLSLALAADQLIVLGASGLIGQGTVAQVLERDWLSVAFGEPVAVIEADGQYLWRPRLGEPGA